MKGQANIPLQGSCLCGAIRYEVARMGAHFAHCHCSMCRKFHGAAFSTFGEAGEGDFRWVQGEELLSAYVAGNGTRRTFCSQCGSSMTFQASDSKDDTVEFALGTVDGDVAYFPDAHIYVAYKANWMELHDDLPRHEEGRNDDLQS